MGALALLGVVASSSARGANPHALLVLDGAGLIEATFNGHVPNPGAYSGYSVSSKNVHLGEATHTICARLGVHFGLFYHLRADVPAVRLPVTITFDHPPWLNSHGVLQSRDQITSWVGAPPPNYAEWYFEDPRELMAGAWRITISHGGNAEIEEVFQVHTACAAAVS